MTQQSDTTAHRGIVVGIDGSQHALDAVAWAATWASKRNSDLTIVLVQPDVIVPTRSWVFKAMREPDFLGHAADAFQKRLQEAADHARSVIPGIKVETLLIDGHPASELVKLSQHADLLVVGTHGAGGNLLSLGGNADAVVTNSHCTTAVIPSDTPHPEGPVVVGVDDEDRAEAMVQLAMEQAHIRKVGLVVVHAWYAPPAAFDAPIAPVLDEAELDSAGHQFISELVDRVSPQFPDVKVTSKVINAAPADALVRESESSGLVIVGSRGRGGFAGLLLGSTSRRVVRLTKCPALVIRPETN